MRLESGFEVRMVAHDCFAGRHRHYCWRQVWWRGEHDRSGRYVACECICHETARGIQ